MPAKVELLITAKDQASGALNGVSSSLKRIAETAAGIVSANVLGKLVDGFAQLAGNVFDFGKESVLAAARVDEMMIVNEVLAKNAGLSSEAVKTEAEEVRQMGIEAAVAQQTVAEFVKANLDLSKASDIARIAQDAAVIAGTNSTEATEAIIHGITTLNPLVLRNAGIIVNLEESYKQYAETLHKSAAELTTAEKQQAALNAVIEAGAGIAGSYAAAMTTPGKILRSFPRYFNDIMIAVGAPFQSAFSDVLMSIADVTKGIAVAFGEGGMLRPILDNIVTVLQPVTDAFSTLNNVVAGFLKGEYTPYAVAQAFKVFLRTMLDVGSGIAQNVLAGLSTFATKFKDGFIEKIKAIDWDAIRANLTAFDWEKVSEAIINGISSIDWNAIGVTMGEFLKTAFAVMADIAKETDWAGIFGSIGKAIADFATGLGGGNWDEFLSVWSENSKQLEQILNNIMAIILNKMQGFVNIGKGVVFALRSGINASWGAFATWIASKMLEIASIYNRVVTLMALKVESFFSIGQNIVLGLKSGIKSAWDAFEGWFVGLINQIIDAALGALGISSPSKVFSGIGKNIMLGLSQGIGDGVNVPINTMLGTFPQLATAAVNSSGSITNNSNNYSIYGATFLLQQGQEGGILAELTE